ncbi:MAG: OmpA family protein, partial [Bdellovibrionales bacterium]|nr:OmpA family protein [Bdellovibrionales bacterium]
MNSSKGNIFVGIGLLFFTLMARAQQIQPGAIEVGPMVGYSFLGDYGSELPDSGLFYGLRTGIFMTENVSFEPTYQYLKTQTSGVPSADVVMHSVRFNLTYNFLPQLRINPLFTGGLGWNRYKSDTPIKSNDLGINIGLGVRAKLVQNINMRIDGRYEFVETDFSEREHNYEGALSINYIFGGESPVDSDGDGIKDKKDSCSGTPQGATVDAKGCPSDEDSDGVYDGIDQCAKTFSGFKVDTKGCTLDTDQDTVPDGPDECPDTPKGAPVDSKGCSRDTDGDNVPDFVDKCPSTPEGTRVDSTGCPQDADQDGILDHVDMCPNTKKGTKVDPQGCPLLMKSKGVLKGVNFYSGKSKLTVDSLRILDSVAKELNEFPNVRVEVQGHTDSVGSDEINLKISQQRADAVLQYLISKGIDPSRLISKGYGETS